MFCWCFDCFHSWQQPCLCSVRHNCTSYLSARKWLSYLPTQPVTAVLTYHGGERLSVAAESSFTDYKKNKKKLSLPVHQSCRILNMAIILHPGCVWCTLLVISRQSILACVLQGPCYGCINGNYHLSFCFDSPGRLGCRRLMLRTLKLQCSRVGNSRSLSHWAPT